MKPARLFVPIFLLALAGCSTPTKESKHAVEAGPVTIPDSYRVRLETTKGPIVITVTKEWAPEGAERFYKLVRNGFYDGARFFRVLPKFVVQFGINGDPKINELWRTAQIPDDKVKKSNLRGFVTFATAGPNMRTTQVFINMKNNSRLDAQGFAPFGEVSSGMDAVEQLYSFYGEGPPRGSGPDQKLIETQGNAYLDRSFQNLDAIKKAVIE